MRDGGALSAYLALAAHARYRCAHVHVDYLNSSKEQARHAPRYVGSHDPRSSGVPDRRLS